MRWRAKTLLLEPFAARNDRFDIELVTSSYHDDGLHELGEKRISGRDYGEHANHAHAALFDLLPAAQIKTPGLTRIEFARIRLELELEAAGLSFEDLNGGTGSLPASLPGCPKIDCASFPRVCRRWTEGVRNSASHASMASAIRRFISSLSPV